MLLCSIKDGCNSHNTNNYTHRTVTFHLQFTQNSCLNSQASWTINFSVSVTTTTLSLAFTSQTDAGKGRLCTTSPDLRDTKRTLLNVWPLQHKIKSHTSFTNITRIHMFYVQYTCIILYANIDKIRFLLPWSITYSSKRSLRSVFVFSFEYCTKFKYNLR